MAHPKMIISVPGKGRQTYVVSRLPLVVGSGDGCHIQVTAAQQVGQRHVVIARGPRPHMLQVEDLGSGLPTLCGGEPLQQHVIVQGDEIQIGDTRLYFIYPPEVATAAGTALELRGLFGPVAGKRYELTEPVTIGRAKGSTIKIADPSVSSHHAVVERDGDRVSLCDLRSRNGSRRNGEAVPAERPVTLELGDVIDIGPLTLVLLPTEATLPVPQVKPGVAMVGRAGSSSQTDTATKDALQPLGREGTPAQGAAGGLFADRDVTKLREAPRTSPASNIDVPLPPPPPPPPLRRPLSEHAANAEDPFGAPFDAGTPPSPPDELAFDGLLDDDEESAEEAGGAAGANARDDGNPDVEPQIVESAVLDLADLERALAAADSAADVTPPPSLPDAAPLSLREPGTGTEDENGDDDLVDLADMVDHTKPWGGLLDDDEQPATGPPTGPADPHSAETIMDVNVYDDTEFAQRAARKPATAGEAEGEPAPPSTTAGQAEPATDARYHGETLIDDDSLALDDVPNNRAPQPASMIEDSGYTPPADDDEEFDLMDLAELGSQASEPVGAPPPPPPPPAPPHPGQRWLLELPQPPCVAGPALVRLPAIPDEDGSGSDRHLELPEWVAIRERMTLGRRRSNDVRLPHGEISGQHAFLTLTGKGLQARDNGSLNGTYVNGIKVEGEVAVPPFAEIVLGPYRFFYVPAGAQFPPQG